MKVFELTGRHLSNQTFGLKGWWLNGSNVAHIGEMFFYVEYGVRAVMARILLNALTKIDNYHAKPPVCLVWDPCAPIQRSEPEDNYLINIPVGLLLLGLDEKPLSQAALAHSHTWATSTSFSGWKKLFDQGVDAYVISLLNDSMSAFAQLNHSEFRGLQGSARLQVIVREYVRHVLQFNRAVSEEEKDSTSIIVASEIRPYPLALPSPSPPQGGYA